jgi:hypothetical protein
MSLSKGVLGFWMVRPKLSFSWAAGHQDLMYITKSFHSLRWPGCDFLSTYFQPSGFLTPFLTPMSPFSVIPHDIVNLQPF